MKEKPKMRLQKNISMYCQEFYMSMQKPIKG